jgi:DNA-binding response OmpR family regulator
MVRRVLLALSDPLLATSLAEQLAHEGPYHATTDQDGAAPQLAVVDAVADHDALLARLRAQHVPVLLLTDGDGIANNADAVLAKPFRFTALVEKLDALAARSAAASDAPVAIGPYMFHPAAKSLESQGRKIRLTEKETAILKYLHASAGTVPRETLLHEVWGYGPAVATHTLETHIYRLRKKIEPDPAEARILLTEDGGYRLSA